MPSNCLATATSDKRVVSHTPPLFAYFRDVQLSTPMRLQGKISYHVYYSARDALSEAAIVADLMTGVKQPGVLSPGALGADGDRLNPWP